MAVLELDFDAPDADEIAPPLDPVIDDFGVVNDVTVKRREGSEGHAVDEDGPLGTDAIGRWTGRVDVNNASDSDLNSIASWHLALGTIEATRWPQVTVDLDALAKASPDLIATVDAIDVGDLVRLRNLPDELDPTLAELVVLGYSEPIGSHRRLITFNTTPATIYQQVGVYGVDPGGVVKRYGTVSELAASFNPTSDTSFTVTVTSGARWRDKTYSPALQVDVGGHLITATTVSGTSNPQTFSGLTIPAGATAVRAAGTAIKRGPAQRGRYGL